MCGFSHNVFERSDNFHHTIHLIQIFFIKKYLKKIIQYFEVAQKFGTPGYEFHYSDVCCWRMLM